MNKGEFIKAMAEKAGFTNKDAATAYDAFVATVTEALKAGDKIQLVGFGSFEVKDVPAKSLRAKSPFSNSAKHSKIPLTRKLPNIHYLKSRRRKHNRKQMTYTKNGCCNAIKHSDSRFLF